MATEDRKYAINPLAAGLMAAGDAISGIYGQRGNTYSTYLDAQMKRQAMEAEVQKYNQAQAQQAFENQLASQKPAQELYQKQQDSIADYAKAGMRPIDPARAMSPGGRMPSKMIPGAYGQMYVPSPALADANMKEFAAKSDMILARQLALRENERGYRQSEESPMSADASGRYAFADEALRNIPKLRSVIFPDGTEKSFRRDIATKMMTPWKYPNDSEVQDAKRWVLSVATGRGLIQSGTVVKDNEWGRLMQQMGIDIASAPKSVFGSLGEQEQFMNDFKGNIKPSSRGGKKESGGSQTFNVGGVTYNIPADKVEAFKKAKGIK